MAIVPDDKDWTWVLERPCPDCGFVAADVDRLDVAAGLRANALQWRGLLTHPAVGIRPSEQQWSGLEYACHVRDVYRLYDQRLGWMLAEMAVKQARWRCVRRIYLVT